MKTVSALPPAVVQTHNALFKTWFPLDRLDIPPRIKPEIGAIADKVSQGMLAEFSESAVLQILEGLTAPQNLPFYGCLKTSKDAAIQAFLNTPGGYGAIPSETGQSVLSFFFRGDCPGTTEFAMQIREIYLSGIWDLPLAGPLAQIQDPQTFVQNIDIYSKRNYPDLPPSKLSYDAASKVISHKDGPIEYLVVGSGPGGATVAHELTKAGKRVVLVETGPFVVWGSMNTMSYPTLMYGRDQATTSNNGIILRSGQALGGGSTVNIDLAFSPLEATIQARMDEWSRQGLIDAKYYTPERISAAYTWVRQAIGTRQVSQSELNSDNLALWDGAINFGVTPSLYHLNRFPTNLSPSPVTQKRDAARELLLPVIQDKTNPLSVIPDASVQEIVFTPAGPDGNIRATGATILINAPWTEYGNTVVDPCNLQIPPGTDVSIEAENIILSAGTIGTARILLQTGQKTPAIANPRIGKGLIMHPSFPLIGVFDQRINLLEGLDSATFLDAFGVAPGFIFETMSGMPAYGAVLIPGTGEQVYNILSQFDNAAGFGAMLVDTPSDSNCVRLQDGNVVIDYTLSDSDKQRFKTAVAIAIRMMFLAGAKQVVIPSNENFLGSKDFDPMIGVYLTDISQADLVEQNLEFLPNRTVLTSAHLQATNKIGPSPDVAVVSTNQRVWNVVTRGEIPNLYVADSSIFPTSVGANPMQSIYTFAKIFSERLIHGMDHDRPLQWAVSKQQPARPLIRTAEA